MSDEKNLMKFDVVVGNPPYQEDIQGSNRSKPIYPLFYDLAQSLSSIYCLITPGRFLFNAGQTNTDWNNQMLNDKHISVLDYNVDSSVFFTNVSIKGGVGIIYYNSKKIIGPIGTFTYYNVLSSVLDKVKLNSSFIFKPISDVLYGMSSYTFNYEALALNNCVEDGMDKSNSNTLAVGSNVFSVYPSLFSSDKNSKSDAGIYGRYNNKRTVKFINSDYLNTPDNFNYYKVFVPGSNGSGAIGEVISTPLIGEPLIGHTWTFISFGRFDNKLEAENLLKYIKSKFARAMLGIKKVTQNNKTKDVWSCVPLQDFTDNSDIDWTKDIADIDQQLYKKYGLSDDEIEFIETKVKKMD